MKITKQARRDARQLFRACLADAVLDDNRVRQAVQSVIRDKPRGYLAVLSNFSAWSDWKQPAAPPGWKARRLSLRKSSHSCRPI